MSGFLILLIIIIIIDNRYTIKYHFIRVIFFPLFSKIAGKLGRTKY